MKREYDGRQPAAERHREVFFGGGERSGQSHGDDRGMLNAQNFQNGFQQESYGGHQDVYGQRAEGEFVS